MTDTAFDLMWEACERYWRTCDALRAAGCIPVEEVEDNVRTVPDGWVLDPWLHFYCPPNFHLPASRGNH